MAISAKDFCAKQARGHFFSMADGKTCFRASAESESVVVVDGALEKRLFRELVRHYEDSRTVLVALLLFSLVLGGAVPWLAERGMPLLCFLLIPPLWSFWRSLRLQRVVARVVPAETPRVSLVFPARDVIGLWMDRISGSLLFTLGVFEMIAIWFVRFSEAKQPSGVSPLFYPIVFIAGLYFMYRGGSLWRRAGRRLG